MRLLCIETPGTSQIEVVSIVKVGSFYNALDRVFVGKLIYYELEEHEGFLYHESLFIPCSSERVEEERMDVIYH
jgi:hypothetical protein